MRPYRHGDPRPPGAERVVRLRMQREVARAARELVQMRSQLRDEHLALRNVPPPRVHGVDEPIPWMT
jgi:hypothetical protein